MCARIREQDPLKQGLKLQPNIVAGKAQLPIREQDPLKQGLKQYTAHMQVAIIANSRARSIKTRIETLPIPKLSPLRFFYSRARSIKTRIETPSLMSIFIFLGKFASKIH